MTNIHKRRIAQLEGAHSGYLTLGEVLDRLDLDGPAPDDRKPHPALVRLLGEMPRR